MADDSNLVLGIEIGDSGKILNTIQDIDSHLGSLKNRLQQIQQNDLADAMRGGDRRALKTLFSETNEITKELKTIQDVAKTWDGGDSILNADYVAGLTQRLSDLNTEAGDTGTKVSQAMESVAVGLGKNLNQLESFEEALKTAEEKAISLRKEMQTTTTIERWTSLNRELNTAEQTVVKLHDALQQASDTQDQMVRGAGELITQYSKTSEIEDYIEGYNKRLVEAQELVEELQDRVDDLRESGADDRIIKIDLDNLEAAKQHLAQMNTSASLDRLNEQIGDLQATYMRLNELARQTDDPAVLDAILKKQEAITKQIEKRTDALAKQRDIQRKSGRSAGNQTGDAALGNASAAVGSLAGFVKGLGDFEVSIQSVDDQWSGFMENYTGSGMVIGEESQKLSELLGNLAVSLENASVGVKKATDVRNEVLKFGDTMGDWGKQIQSQNKSLEASGKSLSRWQKGMGKFGKVAEGLSGKMGMVSKAAGFLTAGFEGVAIGFQVYDALMGKSSEQIAKRIENIKEEFEQTKELNALIEEGNQAAVQSRINAIEEEIESHKKLAEEIRAQAVRNTSTFDQIRTIAGHAFGDSTVYGATGDAIKEVNSEMKTLRKELEGITDPAFQAALALSSMRKEIEKQAEEVTDEIRKREGELFEARMDILDSESKYQDDLIDAEMDYLDERERIDGDRYKQDKQALTQHLSELDTMLTSYQSEVRITTLDHYRELSDMEEKHLDNLADMIESHDENMSEMLKDFNQANADALEDFRESEVESQEDYNKKLAKMEEDYNKEKVKRQRDLQNELFEAEIENDALRHFMLSRQGDIDNAEAEAQHKEELTDEQKAFNEAKDERLKQYREEKAERAEQYKEERAEAIRQHTESIAQARVDFEESQALAKKQHQERLDDMEFRFQQEQAATVKAFRERQQILKTQRAEEDADLLDQLAFKRKQIDTNYKTELEYFQKREEALLDFISKGQDLQSAENRFKSTLSGSADLGYGEAMELLKMLGTEETTRKREYEMSGGPNNDQILELEAIAQAQRKILDYVEGGSTGGFTLSDIVSDADLNAGGAKIGITFSNAIETAVNNQIAKLGEDSRLSLTYYDDESRARAELVEGITRDGGQLAGEMYNTNSQFLKDIGLINTQYGIQSKQEQEELNANLQEVVKAEGEETLDELITIAKDRGDEAIETAEESAQIAKESFDNELNDLISHHTERETNENQFRDDLETAADMANDNMLADDEAFNTAKEALAGEANASLSTMDEEAKAGEIQRESDQNTEIGELSDEYHEDDLERNEEQHEAEVEQDVLKHEEDMLRVQERNELESELWTQFMADLEADFVKSAREMQRDLLKETGRGSQRVVDQHGKMINAIVQGGAKGLNSLNQFIAKAQQQMANLQRQADSRSSSSSSSSSGGGYRSYSEAKAGLMAAKGAFIDRPTALIAGEGDSPELVMPFDESKGIPDNILRQFAAAMVGGTAGLTDKMPAEKVGVSTDQAMIAQLTYALRSLKSGNDMSIGTINVGSNISRQEIREQMGELQQVMVDVMHETINVQ